nr:tannase/feruloyl esterase family alpha/beta hydrolase [Noviherbaspirillum saxi]
MLDPASCRYDPTKDANVLCAANGGNNNTAACVTPTQALAINKIWYGMTSDGSVPDPAVDNGTGALTGAHKWYGLMRGTSLLGLASPVPFDIAAHQVALELQNSSIAVPSFKNATGNGQDGWKSLSYAQLSEAFDRGVALQPQFSFIDTDNPDLSAFKARGGKLIHTVGGADTHIPTGGSVNYYERVLAQMGGVSAVQPFYRFFFVPGWGHGSFANGSSNATANPPLLAKGQIYSLLTNWVEKGVAPDTFQVTSRSSSPVAKSLPLCVYPKKITYVNGDLFQAASYTCQ